MPRAAILVLGMWWGGSPEQHAGAEHGGGDGEGQDGAALQVITAREDCDQPHHTIQLQKPDVVS
jgi:hypothetical protein